MTFLKYQNILYTDKCFKAFTLAEVLLTLVIIGVLAAIAIPSLMQTTQRQEFVSGLKKAHSTLTNALYKINLKNGYPQGDYSYLDEQNFLDEFSTVTNVVKQCDSYNSCFGNGKGFNQVYKTLSGASPTTQPGKAIILSDGEMYTYKNMPPSGVHGLSSKDKNNTIGRIVVDINGQKKPNRYGYDTFIFYLVDEKGIVPAGNYTTSDCNKTDKGYMCAAKVLKESKIDY